MAMTSAVTLTRYEISRIIGLRSLQLELGAPCEIDSVLDKRLQIDFMYMAALELLHRKLDVWIERERGQPICVKMCKFPQELFILLDSKDGQCRKMES